jgi:DNA-directed RNA polymerase specialized sigma24 family protein
MPWAQSSVMAQTRGQPAVQVTGEQTSDAHASACYSSRLEQLMMRYQDADPSAAAALIELLSAPLYRFFASKMGSTTDAQDTLQDAWLHMHRVRHTYRPGKPVLPWAFAIAQRVLVDSCRKQRHLASARLDIR